MKKSIFIKIFISALLVLLLLADTGLAAEGSGDVYYSDLFYGYSPNYLKSEYLTSYAQDSAAIMSRVFNDYVDSPAFIWTEISTAINSATDARTLIELISDASGISDYNYSNALNKANEELVKELLSDKELAGVSAVYAKGGKITKKAENIAKLYEEFQENFEVYQLTDEQIISEYYAAISHSGIYENLSTTQIKVYTQVLLPNIEPVKEALGVGTTALEACSAFALALLAEDIRMEIIDDIAVAATPETVLHDGMKRLQSQLNDGWSSYMYENYLKDELISELYSVFTKKITGSLTAYGFVTSLLKVASWVSFDVLFNVPDLEDIMVQSVLASYSGSLYQILQQKILAFDSSVTTTEIFGYENCFCVYAAATALGLEASEKLALASNEEDLESVLYRASSFTYGSYIEMVKAELRLIEKGQRELKSVQQFAEKLPVSICDPSDEIVPSGVYMFDGAVQGDVELLYHYDYNTLEAVDDLYCPADDAVINGSLTAYILSMSDVSLEIKGDLMIDESLRLEQTRLTAGGDMKTSALLFNNASAEIKGNVEFQWENGNRFAMTHRDDYLLVHGSFTGNYWGDDLNVGTVEVKGDFTGWNYNPRGEHVTVLSGEEKQTVSGYFGTVYLNNPDIFFDGEIQHLIQHLILQQDYVLNQDVNADVLYLNGYNLTVNGDMLVGCYDDHENGLFVNGGKLTVNGDLTVSGKDLSVQHGQVEVKGDLEICGYSVGCLYMGYDDDYVLVHGDFSCTDANLRGGRLELKGDFYSKGFYNYDYSDHAVIFSGTDEQIVSFYKADNDNTFGTVYLNNPNVVFATSVYDLKLQQNYAHSRNLTVTNMLDLNGYTLTVFGELKRKLTYTNGGMLINVYANEDNLEISAEYDGIRQVNFVLASYDDEGRMNELSVNAFVFSWDHEKDVYSLSLWDDCAKVKVFVLDGDFLPIAPCYVVKERQNSV